MSDLELTQQLARFFLDIFGDDAGLVADWAEDNGIDIDAFYEAAKSAAGN